MREKTNRIVWALVQSMFATIQASFALEPGFYGPLKNPNECNEILSLQKLADCKLGCSDVDKIDIGIRRTNSEVVYFSRSELEYYLQTQRHKDLLYMSLHPGTDSSIEKPIAQFLRQFGYRRVFIVRGSGAGTFVLMDISAKFFRRTHSKRSKPN